MLAKPHWQPLLSFLHASVVFLHLVLMIAVYRSVFDKKSLAGTAKLHIGSNALLHVTKNCLLCEMMTKDISANVSMCDSGQNKTMQL